MKIAEPKVTVTMKGGLAIAAGNKLKAVMQGRQNENVLTGGAIADGKTHVVLVGNEPTIAKAVRPDLVTEIKKHLVVGGLFAVFDKNGLVDNPDSAVPKLTAKGFKAAGMEKIGAIETQ